MILTLTFSSLVYLVAVVLGTIISLICWFYPYTEKSFRLLGASVFSITWALFIFFLLESGLMHSTPHLFQTSFLATILYLPFSYLFVRNIFQNRRLTWKDLIHALPLILFLVDYSPIYLLSAAEKLKLIATDSNSGFIFRQGWFIPAKLHPTLRLILLLLYYGAQFHIVLHSVTRHRRKILYYLSAQFLMVVAYFVYQFIDDPIAWRTISVCISCYLVLAAITLLVHPHVLYRLERGTNSDVQARELRHDRDLKNEKSTQQICRRLESFMSSELPFLRHGYTLDELSNAIHIPSYRLSAILNQYLKLSFHDYLNMHRIAYCKDKILKGAAELITLEALAYECGFNNRNSFTSAFKHFNGTTPSDFLRAQRNLHPAAKDS